MDNLDWLLILVGVACFAGALSILSMNRRQPRANRQFPPRLADHIHPDYVYNVLLDDGKLLKRVRFVCLTSESKRDDPTIPSSGARWIVLQKLNGKRIFVQPGDIRFYEECDDTGVGNGRAEACGV